MFPFLLFILLLIAINMKEGYINFPFFSFLKRKKHKNIFNEDIEICSLDPLTGWHRNGKCTTDDFDYGTHTVCSKMTQEFLDYTKSKGNNLSDPKKSFPGLKPGDHWCLCSLRWLEAKKEGKAPPIKLKATHEKTLKDISFNKLISHNQKEIS